MQLENVEKSFIIFSSLHDPGTERHSERTADLCMKLAEQIKMPKSSLENLRLAATFHDIGKVGVDRHIINKAGPLTDGEWAMIKMHPIFGYRILTPLGLDDSVRKAVRSHHENYDGRGYPDLLAGEQIPLMARMIKICDVYDALCSDRPDRKAFSSTAALENMWLFEHNFDKLLLDQFTNMVDGHHG